MTGTIIHREIVHYTEETVQYADAAQAVKGVAEREAEGWSVIDRRHDDLTVAVVFRRDHTPA